MSRLASKLVIGGAAVGIVAIGACVVSYQRYMRPRSLGRIPPASALVVTDNLVGPQARRRITDPPTVALVIERMNAQVGSGWQPVLGEAPLPKLSVNIETVSGDVAYWTIGEIWYGAGGLYKDVPLQERDELVAMLTDAASARSFAPGPPAAPGDKRDP